MTAYSFKARFIEPIELGRKRQTIRAIGRRHHAMIGGTLQLYTGMRTKHCRLIGTAVCSDKMLITIDVGESLIWLGRDTCLRTKAKLDPFAVSDGFADFDDMAAFWRANHGTADFTGVLIRWRDFSPASRVEGLKPFIALA